MGRGVSALAIALVSLTLVAAEARADATPAPLRNPNIDIAYVEPQNPDFEPLYKGLQARKVLEELRAFLAPLKLPRKILIKVEQCDQPTEIYKPGGPVVICYEYVDELRKLAAAIPASGASEFGVTRDDAIVGAFIQTALQRTASAVFDVLNVPIWGREEDAADKLAAFLMLQFGPQAARKLVNGSAYFFRASDHSWTGADFAGQESTESQRYYNYLCIAYGEDPSVFADYYQTTDQRADGATDALPASRVFWCPREYSEEKWAFARLILPYVDQDLMSRVLARDWLKPFVE